MDIAESFDRLRSERDAAIKEIGLISTELGQCQSTITTQAEQIKAYREALERIGKGGLGEPYSAIIACAVLARWPDLSGKV